MKDDDLIRNINPFGLRMRPSVRAMAEEAAKKNHRSLNAEITARLESTFELDDYMAEMQAGGHAEVIDMVISIIAENSRFQGGEQKLTALLKTEIESVLDDKMKQLEERLLAAQAARR
jgi:hypothetical protein